MNPLPAGEHRLYHSMAFLADDGSVISLSSNPKGQARSDTVLRFEPPYLFKGPRPTLSGVPGKITYGQTYPINVSSDVTRVDDDERRPRQRMASMRISARFRCSTPTARSPSMPRQASRRAVTTGSSRSTPRAPSPSRSGPN